MRVLGVFQAACYHPEPGLAHVLAVQAMAPPFTIIFLLFGGFYINVDNLPDGAKWVPSVSIVKWSFQGRSVSPAATPPTQTRDPSFLLTTHAMHA
jgi:hypothetical protein